MATFYDLLHCHWISPQSRCVDRNFGKSNAINLLNELSDLLSMFYHLYSCVSSHSDLKINLFICILITQMNKCINWTPIYNFISYCLFQIYILFNYTIRSYKHNDWVLIKKWNNVYNYGNLLYRVVRYNAINKEKKENSNAFCELFKFTFLYPFVWKYFGCSILKEHSLNIVSIWSVILIKTSLALKIS